MEFLEKLSEVNIEEKCAEGKALSTRDYIVLKVVQATHHQGDIRYVVFRGIQCSCMSLMLVSWTLFKSPGSWDKLDLDSILVEGDQLFKFIGKFM